jgi:glycerate kinase
VLGIGGSACTDGGAGLLTALGARLLDEAGQELPFGGKALSRLAALDLSALSEVDIELACDVENPIDEAASVYGPQKGASPADVETLGAALRHWASIAGPEFAERPGAGAAGGVGFAAMAVLGARVRPGIELLLDLLGFDAALTGASLVITGEGSLDEQTLSG